MRGWWDRATDIGDAPKTALFVLFGLNAVDEFDRLAFATLTPEIRDAFDLSDQQIVAVGSVSALFVLLASIPVGYLTDRYSRVRLAAVAAVVWAVMALLIAGAWAVPVLFAARFFGGIARSSNEIVHTGLLADYYEPRVLPRVFQIHRLANPLAQLSSLVAGVIGALLGWRWAFVLLALPTFALVGTLARLREPHRGATIDPEAAAALAGLKDARPTYLKAARQLFRVRTLRRIWAGFFVFGIAILAFGQMLSLFFDQVYGFGPLGRGLVSFVFGLGTVAGLITGGQLGSRHTSGAGFSHLTKLVGVGFATFAAGTGLLALAPWAPLSLVCAFLGSAGVSIIIPILLSLMVRILPPLIRAQGQSFTLVAIGIGGLFAIPVAGLGESIGYRPAFLVLSAIMLAAAPVIHSAHRFVERDVAAADAALSLR